MCHFSIGVSFSVCFSPPHSKNFELNTMPSLPVERAKAVKRQTQVCLFFEIREFCFVTWPGASCG